ncbi:MAG TPA: prolyl oligopeptidase family serine peptidase [Bacteroidales bacterium]|nr:prolyl oligopeptidase family serine peptidase [Bacteroidales bacterium]
MIKKPFAFLAISMLVMIAHAQQQPLDHTIYDKWKVLEKTNISPNGEWVTYEVNPGKGDGMLYFFNTKSQTTDSVARGYGARFAGNSEYIVFKIKPTEDTLRKAKLAKKEKDDLPKDSLGIFAPGVPVRKFAQVKSFKVAEEGGDWVAFLHEKLQPVKDTTDKSDTAKTEKEKPVRGKKKKKKAEGSRLVLLNMANDSMYRFEDVTDYSLSRNEQLIAFITCTSDSIDSTRVFRFDPKLAIADTLFNSQGFARQLAVDEQGDQLAFVYSADTSKTKNFDLAYWQKEKALAAIIVDSAADGLTAGWRVSEHRAPTFTRDGAQLYFGTAPRNEPEPKDTVPKDEKVLVDVWNWRDDYIQPQQKKMVDNERKRSYLAVWHPDGRRMVQLADELVQDVATPGKDKTPFVLGYSNKPYRIEAQWDGFYRDFYTIDVNDGSKKLLTAKASSSVALSPEGKYFVWYSPTDSAWYLRDVKTDEVRSLTKPLPFAFYDELNDVPQLPGNYGYAGFTKDDRYVLINDRYDIWRFDMRGKEAPVRITDGVGRDNNLQFRYWKLDRRQDYIEKEMMLYAFDLKSRASGFYSATAEKAAAARKLIMQPYSFDDLSQARDAKTLIWRKSDFDLYPDLYYSDENFENPVRISHLDSQRAPWRWGDVQQVQWISANGDSLEGLLYTPENLDASTKYPMLAYFYERNADNFHRFYHVTPSRSIINPAWCVSNGYVVFVPDIPYTTGFPGQSAENAIVSGTLAMAGQFPYIDRNRMGIQGQSWGGYQVAYLVTQTNLYAAAMAGAPVSNMASAYGGIRWGSGMSRMFLYEKTQSRLGGSLWEMPLRYIENSPLFFADKVETPLLIMHNDNDGAVPWYQGIEMFMALRRLQKPVWMLTYNDEEHNLTRWPNRVDLSIRMMQFFDHYLKDAPEPVWMKDGVPAIDKATERGYELEEE